MHIRVQTSTLAVIFVVIGLLPIVVTGPYWRNILITAMYYAMMACSWNLLSGFAGQFSLAPAAFSLLGAYTCGVLYFKFGVPVVAGILIAIPVTFIIGLLVGLLVLRMKGPYLALTTFAFLEVAYLIVSNANELTRGDLGLSLPGISGFTMMPYYYLFFGGLLAINIFLWVIIKSKAGYFLQAIRDNEYAAEASGVHVVYWKILVFAISSAICGLAGALYVNYLNLASPDIGTILESGLIIGMVVIGGVGSLPGPIIGAFLFELGSEWLRGIGVQHMLIFAILMILVIRFFRYGLWGSIEITLMRRMPSA